MNKKRVLIYLLQQAILMATKDNLFRRRQCGRVHSDIGSISCSRRIPFLL